jgi:anti-anti-sigma regulatory factor
MLSLLENHGSADETDVLPLPPLLDTRAVVLAGMLAGGMRPLLLDATAVTEVEERAVPLLLALLRVKQAAGLGALLLNVSPRLREALRGSELEPWLEARQDPPEVFLTCPDRDGPGYLHSER